MADAAERAVRAMCAAWADDDVETFVRAFSDDGLWIDTPRGSWTGSDAIRLEYTTERAMAGPVQQGIQALVSDGRRVMAERVDTWEVGGHPIVCQAVGVYEVDDGGRVTRWQDYYDFQSIIEQYKASGMLWEDRLEGYERTKAELAADAPTS